MRINRVHRWPLVGLVVFILLTGLGVWPHAIAAQLRSKTVENFSHYKIGKFPKNFRTYPFQRHNAKKVYAVAEEENNQFLRAVDDQDISVQAMRDFHWDVERYPWITWKWRARTLPEGGDERQPASNDSACGVYIIFGKYTGKVLKYVWSNQAPVGTVVKKKPGQMDIIVLQSGVPRQAGQWETVRINVPEAYQKAFGEPLDKNPSGIGLLTDGNALHVGSACDYDDFVLHTRADRLSSASDSLVGQ